ncbi:DoxX family protein [Pleurocapsales cyanobacterium LEGE 06147]|nr:DoxX family protein [Pleurocapsales cyanobacterium LEGE 06147]
MVVLIVLLATFALSILIRRIRSQPVNYRVCGRIALSAMFLFAGISHFLLADGMVKMLPQFLPFRYPIVYVTGLIEIAFSLGFLLPKYFQLTGILAIAFLIAVFPSNVYAALNAVDFGGNVAGPIYLLFRVPMQVFLIVWVWVSSDTVDELNKREIFAVLIREIDGI